MLPCARLGARAWPKDKTDNHGSVCGNVFLFSKGPSPLDLSATDRQAKSQCVSCDNLTIKRLSRRPFILSPELYVLELAPFREIRLTDAKLTNRFSRLSLTL